MNGMAVSTLTGRLSGWRSTSQEREYESGWDAPTPPGPAEPNAFLSWKELRTQSRGAVEIAFDYENGYIIVEVIAAKIRCAVIDIDHEVLGGQ